MQLTRLYFFKIMPLVKFWSIINVTQSMYILIYIYIIIRIIDVSVHNPRDKILNNYKNVSIPQCKFMMTRSI